MNLADAATQYELTELGKTLLEAGVETYSEENYTVLERNGHVWRIANTYVRAVEPAVFAYEVGEWLSRTNREEVVDLGKWGTNVENEQG